MARLLSSAGRSVKNQDVSLQKYGVSLLETLTLASCQVRGDLHISDSQEIRRRLGGK
jgi:hypothetical protein